MAIKDNLNVFIEGAGLLTLTGNIMKSYTEHLVEDRHTHRTGGVAGRLEGIRLYL